MPTYEYLCTKCEHEFEIFQPITDKSLITCPKELCAQKRWGKGKVKKKIGAGAGLIFKGSGFYITDYRSDSYKEAAKKESGSASSTIGEKKGTDGGTKESKPAATKSETKPAPKMAE
ncbi:MAG TPA: FmdB family zinc ribbon protein [Verrucomicrobiae bacterium]|nr:FmdB family zinc ribbon protein [Verrucomicrobiae bacterium]